MKYIEVIVDTKTNAQRLEMNVWCNEVFGKSCRVIDDVIYFSDSNVWTWRAGPKFGYRTYVFLREKDAVYFALRWR